MKNIRPRIIIILAIVLVAAPVSAQSLRELSNRPQTTDAARRAAYAAREHEERDALNTATWVYVAAAAGDWTATAVCERAWCGEHTQTGFLYGVEKPAVAIPVALAIDAAWVFGIRELVAPDHPKLARGLLYVSSAVRLVFTVNKVNDLRDRFPARR